VSYDFLKRLYDFHFFEFSNGSLVARTSIPETRVPVIIDQSPLGLTFAANGHGDSAMNPASNMRN
jgi:hypothetical protein